jgi:hypothetical protein
MTRDDIIRMAMEAGLWPTEEWSKEYGIPTPNEQWLPELERFAALVAAAEREACAKVCEVAEDDEFYTGRQYAAAIRARSES